MRVTWEIDEEDLRIGIRCCLPTALGRSMASASLRLSVKESGDRRARRSTGECGPPTTGSTLPCQHRRAGASYALMRRGRTRHLRGICPSRPTSMANWVTVMDYLNFRWRPDECFATFVVAMLMIVSSALSTAPVRCDGGMTDSRRRSCRMERVRMCVLSWTSESAGLLA
jgi:hypothetical protein